MPFPLVHLLMALILIGAIFYILQLWPMDERLVRIIQIIVVVVMLFWLLNVFVGIPWLPLRG
jgi:hypothetical protein